MNIVKGTDDREQYPDCKLWTIFYLADTFLTDSVETQMFSST